jgi:1-acyl-sn-glycerol-3-phosphate acyltransferase
MTKDILSWERNASVFWLTTIISKFLLAPFFRIKTQGIEHLPTQNAFILLPKHQRWEDIPLLSLATPRPLYYMAKYELFLNPISRWLLTSLGGIPLNRKRPMESRRALQRMIGYLKKGEGIVIFPEGTYYRDKMGPGHSGLIRMIISRSRVPFIPVGINYSKKRGRTLAQINFSGSIYADGSAKADDLLRQIMTEIAKLSGL